MIDIQVNGYAGINFNSGPIDERQLGRAVDRLRTDGVGAILATIVTDDLSRMAARLASLRHLIDQDAGLQKLIPAFHIEGPFISAVEGYRGAHPVEHIRPAEVGDMNRLLDAAGGLNRVALVTLAPEVDHRLAVTRRLVEQGIHVAAGHTDAPLDLLLEAEQAGLDLFTHLGNGSAALMDRHDNIINRALSLEKIRYSLIADGHHLPWFVLRNYIHAAGIERCLITTDCTAGAGAGPDFDPGGDRVIDRTGETPVLRLEGTPYLAGACATMKQNHDNLIRHVGLTESQARALCVDNPLDFIRKWAG